MPFVDKSTLTYPATNSFPVRKWIDTRDPTTSDYKSFQLFDLWINESSLKAWIMVGRTATSGTWIQMASTGTGILDLTGNSGGAVGPDGSNNINIIGTSPVSVTGNPGTNTLAIAVSGAVSDSFPTDSGTAIPSAGALTIHGGTGVTTSGAGSTVTITANAAVPTNFTADSGSAIPLANNLNVFGGTGISTSGAGHTLTIAAAATVATTYTADSGSATPSANNLNIVGAGGTVTSASGSTVTITSTGGGLTWTEITVVGPTTMAVNNGYIANSASQVQLLLPATAALGSILRIVGKGSGLFIITQAAGQSIHFLSNTSTVGVGGSIASLNQFGTIELVCTVANTTWTVADAMGNFTIT